MFRVIVLLISVLVLSNIATADHSKNCLLTRDSKIRIPSCGWTIKPGVGEDRNIKTHSYVSRMWANLESYSSFQADTDFRNGRQTVELNSFAQNNSKKLKLAATKPVPGIKQLPALLTRVKKGVVSISAFKRKSKGNKARAKAPKDTLFAELFADIFDGASEKKNPPIVGTGFIFDPSGLILTAANIVENADEIVVTFDDGTKLKTTEVVGVDPKTDIAIVKVDQRKSDKGLQFGDSSIVRKGDWALVVSNSFGLGGSANVGIVVDVPDKTDSADDEYIHVDVVLNPGSTGSPLINLMGEVVGINGSPLRNADGTADASRAIPANTIKRVISALLKAGKVRKGWIGLRSLPISPPMAKALGLGTAQGAFVAVATPGGPADIAGIQTGDVIVELDGQVINAPEGLEKVISATPPDTPVNTKIFRNRELTSLKVVVGTAPLSKKKLSSSQSAQRPTARALQELGLVVSDLTPELRKTYGIDQGIRTGIIITKVRSNGSGAKIGLRPGVVIAEIDSIAVSTVHEALNHLKKLKNEGRKRVILFIKEKQKENGPGGVRFTSIEIE